MLREFVNCNSNKERYEVITKESQGIYSASEVDTICEIMGIKTDEDSNKQKIQQILETLESNMLKESAGYLVSMPKGYIHSETNK